MQKQKTCDIHKKKKSLHITCWKGQCVTHQPYTKAGGVQCCLWYCALWRTPIRVGHSPTTGFLLSRYSYNCAESDVKQYSLTHLPANTWSCCPSVGLLLVHGRWTNINPTPDQPLVFTSPPNFLISVGQKAWDVFNHQKYDLWIGGGWRRGGGVMTPLDVFVVSSHYQLIPIVIHPQQMHTNWIITQNKPPNAVRYFYTFSLPDISFIIIAMTFNKINLISFFKILLDWLSSLLCLLILSLFGFDWHVILQNQRYCPCCMYIYIFITNKLVMTFNYVNWTCMYLCM